MNLLNDEKFHEKIDDEFFQNIAQYPFLFNRTAKLLEIIKKELVIDHKF